MPGMTEKMSELQRALHRKLVRYSDDIRKAGKNPKTTREETLKLKSERKQIDQAYSLCCKLVRQGDEQAMQDNYPQLLRTYSSL